MYICAYIYIYIKICESSNNTRICFSIFRWFIKFCIMGWILIKKLFSTKGSGNQWFLHLYNVFRSARSSRTQSINPMLIRNIAKTKKSGLVRIWYFVFFFCLCPRNGLGRARAPPHVCTVPWGTAEGPGAVGDRRGARGGGCSEGLAHGEGHGPWPGPWHGHMQMHIGHRA